MDAPDKFTQLLRSCAAAHSVAPVLSDVSLELAGEAGCRIVYEGQGQVHADGSDEADLQRWRLKQRMDCAQSTSAVKRKRSCSGGGVQSLGASTRTRASSHHSTSRHAGGVLGVHSPQLRGKDEKDESSDEGDEGGDDIEDALEAALEAAACGDLEFSSEEEWPSSASEDVDVNANACELGEDSCAKLEFEAEGANGAPQGNSRCMSTRASQKGMGNLAREAEKGEARDVDAAPYSFSQVQCYLLLLHALFVWFHHSYKYVSQVLAIALLHAVSRHMSAEFYDGVTKGLLYTHTHTHHD
jgi:hypothetical protein